jgi:hypothetical protein
LQAGIALPPSQVDTALQLLDQLGVGQFVTADRRAGVLALERRKHPALVIDHDTTGLARELGLDTCGSDADLQREIWLALLAAPRSLGFPSLAELQAAVRMRANIVRAARKTALAFHTHEAERPEELWRYSPETGFTVRPGASLIEALERATQPERSGRLYDFSCYRATEYVILLAMAQETREHHPELHARLQRQSELRAVMSGEFHDVFLRELGDTDDPLPAAYYVPGDRVWFRNPDPASSDATGFEGSWVFYLGDGLFSNFWKRDQPFTLQSKCLEIYHWRHGLYRDEQGEARIDEAIVAEHVAQTLLDPEQTAHIVARMMRLRDPKGVYLWGGCMDRSRESPRWVCPGTADVKLPDA